jgi:hypothetical protein
MAYGIVEEGLAVKSFFSIDWPDLGVLASYGRLLGVNFVWALALTVYHGLISILIPIVITELVFSDVRDVPWVSSVRKLYLLGLVFLFDIFFFNFFFVGYFQPTIYHYIASLLVIYLLYRFSLSRSLKPLIISGRPLFLWFLGLFWMLSFYLIYFGFPHLSIPFPLVIFLGLIHGYIGFRLVLIADRLEVEPYIRMATALGPPSLFIFLSPLFEFDLSRPDNTSGSIFVGIVFAIIFFLLYRRCRGYDYGILNTSVSS